MFTYGDRVQELTPVPAWCRSQVVPPCDRTCTSHFNARSLDNAGPGRLAVPTRHLAARPVEDPEQPTHDPRCHPQHGENAGAQHAGCQNATSPGLRNDLPPRKPRPPIFCSVYGRYPKRASSSRHLRIALRYKIDTQCCGYVTRLQRTTRWITKRSAGLLSAHHAVVAVKDEAAQASVAVFRDRDPLVRRCSQHNNVVPGRCRIWLGRGQGPGQSPEPLRLTEEAWCELLGAAKATVDMLLGKGSRAHRGLD